MLIEKKINIIAPNVNTGGALVLLEYIMKYFKKKSFNNCRLNIFKSKALKKKDIDFNILYINSNLFSLFRKISNALYFGNLPPLFKSSNSIVYIHNLYIMDGYRSVWNSKDINLKTKIKNTLLISYMKLTIHNVDYVMCQTNTGKKLLKKNFNHDKILICPIFDDSYIPKIRTKEFDLCYVGLPSSHKNHERLFRALDNLGKKGITLTIAVTVPEQYALLLKLMSEINKNITITNFGMVSNKKVYEIYEKSRMLIFPSLKESFGLPLIEAARCNLPIIASDLDYVYDVIIPSDTFDPLSLVSIENCIEQNIHKSDISKTKLLAENKIDMIFNILIKK